MKPPAVVDLSPAVEGFDLLDWRARWTASGYRAPAVVACPCGRHRIVARESESIRCNARCAPNVTALRRSAAR